MEVEVRLRQPDGFSRWVRLSTDIQYDDTGSPMRLLGAVVDVQLLKEAAAARTRALLDAERTGRAKDEFLATMSHELPHASQRDARMGEDASRSPLDVKKREHGPRGDRAECRDPSAFDQRSARCLPDLSRKLMLKVQRIAVSAVVYAAVDVVRQAADAKGVRLIVNLDPNVGFIVGDPDRLQQIIWNLLSNSVKFHGRRRDGDGGGERRDSTVVIRVHDDGRGSRASTFPFVSSASSKWIVRPRERRAAWTGLGDRPAPDRSARRHRYRALAKAWGGEPASRSPCRSVQCSRKVSPRALSQAR